ncbi:MATE family efflux transporter [Roseinatronobacter bogoriensis]|uniref:MATE family efflux transporter n=1 Tax=Roseinatronobacter bogoriensis subsp. barguzinensis TaxID=441209 RepID=A0A2K8KBT8_9RHOB|nr:MULTISPECIES: MATE family efflux transporter [Rhodobaca]ATX66902.1 MATE family efflux transporter [Rhodobaca barguzinensis]MBB4206380.1 MATE family multidrug resistance protein [Rhodobaca bogoriensis DSM 18756]TDW41125.1 MATE family multidrug resistance protein [Rhodobaca barguzinensis]TDY74697.1 MATE family multidrug resistance protein [Rhodobaca bogoriensis DSM 18756]
MTAKPQALTDRRILKIAIPIVLANLSVPILGAVDTGVVGQMGAAAPIGAVGLGAIILASIYWIFGFLRMGTTGLVAQATGAGDLAESGAILTRGVMIGLVAGLVMVLGQVLIMEGAFRIAPASPEVEGLARQYLSIRIWGAPATIALYAVNGWLIATERTRGVLVLQLWMNGLNIVLDLWFVLGLGWGVQGVAIATLIAELTALALGLWLCRAAFAGAQWRDRARVFDRVRLKRMWVVNSDIMLRTIALQAAMTGFLFTSAGFGDVELAGNQILWQFLMITAYALDGFAFAAEALVGQAVGARSVGLMRQASIRASIWAFGAAMVMALGFWGAGPWVIDLMATDTDVRAAARVFLPYVVVLSVLGLAAYMLDGIFIGATGTREMRNTVILAVAIYGLVIWLAVPVFGNHGLWMALIVLNVLRGVFLGVLYPRLERRVGAAGG